MTCDVIIVSNSLTPAHRKLTMDAVQSAFTSENSHSMNVIVVEQQSRTSFQGCTTVHYDGPFHYNALLNIAANQSKSQWIAFCNNDILFHEGWFTEILKQAKATGIHSWGCYAPGWQYQNKHITDQEYIVGYRIGIHMTGWVIVMKRKLWELIGGFGTRYSFHFSDYEYAEQLLEAGIPHAVACKSRVTHLLSQTYRAMSKAEQRELSEANRLKYEQLCRERGYKYPEIYGGEVIR